MGLKLIGAGLGRTGTASLKVAIEELGIGKCYHMSEVLRHPERTSDWIDAARGRPDWDRIFGEYSATVDYPGCAFWKQLAKYYPKAKILLTVRDPGKWFDSTSETILSPAFSDFIRSSPFGEMVDRVIWESLDHQMGNRDFMVSYFEKRNADIIETVPAERLLVYNVNEGWEPLCQFLDVPVPDKAFPHVNSRDETREMLATLIASGGEQTLDEAMVATGQKLHGS